MSATKRDSVRLASMRYLIAGTLFLFVQHAGDTDESAVFVVFLTPRSRLLTKNDSHFGVVCESHRMELLQPCKFSCTERHLGYQSGCESFRATSFQYALIGLTQFRIMTDHRQSCQLFCTVRLVAI